MKPLKPKYTDSVKVDWKISKKSKDLVTLYSKYSRYDESEIIDKVIYDLLEDSEFTKWLETRRYQSKIKNIMASENELLDIRTPKGVEILEENEEDSQCK
jgi:hypothetical protein